MFRTSVVAAVVISLFSISGVYAGQAHRQDKYQKINTYKAKIAPKGLKGPAYKSAMSDCTINPDNYN